MLLQKWCPLCNLRARDPHQLLLNTSHFLPLSLEKLLSYAGAPLTHTITEKKWNSCPQFLACRRASMFRDRLSSKKNCTYIPLPCTMYLYCNIYVPTYLSFDSSCTMGSNHVRNCILVKQLWFHKIFSTFNLQ